MQPWRPYEIVEIVLQGLSGVREQGNTRMRIKMRKTVGAVCAQCAPSLRLVCAIVCAIVCACLFVLISK